MKGPGVPYARYTIYDNLPAAGDDLHFSASLSSADCVLPPYGGSPPAPLPPPPPYSPPSPPPPPPPSPPPPVHAGDVFNSIRLEGGYTGSVVLARDLQVNILEVGSGNIAQNYGYDLTASGNTHAGDLTVSGTFAWTGGGIQYGPRAPVLNGDIIPGNVDLAPGATGLAEPTDGQTVELGSSLTLKGDSGLEVGSILEMKEGIFELLNGMAGFVIQDQSLLHIKAPVPKAPSPPPSPPSTPGKIELNRKTDLTNQANTKGFVENEKGGKVIVEAADRPANNTDFAKVSFRGDAKTYFTNAGTVILKDRAWLHFNHTDTTTLGGYQQNSVDDDPVTFIQAGCMISCQGRSDVEIAKGSLVLTELKDGTGTPLADQPDVTVDASNSEDMEFAFKLAEEADIAWASNRTSVPIRLNVVGAVRWDGTVCLFAHDSILKNDSLEATKKIEVGSWAHLEVKWFEASDGEGTHLWDTWHLVKGEEINKKPECDLSNPAPGGIRVRFDLVDDKAIDMTYVQ